MLCPCARMTNKKPLLFNDCCGRYLDHFETTPAPDAESLMRSRYCAFVLERAAYLCATWSLEHRPEQLDFDASVKWLGLEVKACRTLDAEHAEVEFIARNRLNGRATRLHEVSRFVREQGRWFYIDGTYPST